MEIFLKYTVREKSTKKYIYIKLSHTSKNHLYSGMLPGLRTRSQTIHLYKFFMSSVCIYKLLGSTIWRRAKGAVDRHCLSPRTPEIIQRFSSCDKHEETSISSLSLLVLHLTLTRLALTTTYKHLQTGEGRCHQPHIPGSSTASSVPIKATEHHPSCDASRQR